MVRVPKLGVSITTEDETGAPGEFPEALFEPTIDFSGNGETVMRLRWDIRHSHSEVNVGTNFNSDDSRSTFQIGGFWLRNGVQMLLFEIGLGK